MIQISQVYANDSNSLKFIERIYSSFFYLMKTKQSDLSLIGNGMTFPMSNTSP